MGVTYIDPEPSVTRMLHDLLAEYYPPLLRLKCDLDIRCRMLIADGDAHPVSVGGYPALAAVRVVPLRWRAAGAPDVWIEVDGDEWRHLGDPERRALIHHELHHIDVVDLQQSREDPAVYVCKVDTLGRPRIKLRRHDWQLGGFRSIAEIHGEAAPEVIGLRVAASMLDQGVFGFVQDAPATVPMEALA